MYAFLTFFWPKPHPARLGVLRFAGNPMECTTWLSEDLANVVDIAHKKYTIHTTYRTSCTAVIGMAKLLCGVQVTLVKTGKPYVMFGDGTLASCKPISESDLASFMADCVRQEDKINQVLPIGGEVPGSSWYGSVHAAFFQLAVAHICTPNSTYAPHP
jgi:hypothetical protein